MDQLIFRSVESLLDRFLNNLSKWLSDHGFEIAIILCIAWVIRRYGSQFISRLFHHTVRADLYPTKADREKRLMTIDSLINAVLKVGVFIVATLMIVSELGVNTTPLIASAGIVGLVIGFGAQSMIKDFTSGIFLILDNQYRVGDIVQLSPQVEGKVEAINIRTTVVRDLAGTLFHVSNGSILWTANKTMNYGGFDENIVFPASTDIDKLELIINRVGKNLANEPKFEKKIKEPPHFKRITGFDPNGITIKVLAVTAPNDSWDIKGEFFRRLVRELRRANIEIASKAPEVPEKKTKKKP